MGWAVIGGAIRVADVVEEGSWVYLYIDRKRGKVLRAARGKIFSSDKGSIDLGSIVGASYGAEVVTSSGVRGRIYIPSISDLIYSVFSRPTQVIYPKDAGYVVLALDISPGKRILEIGMGSGAMTAYMANLVRPGGRVYAYEVREDIARIAMENLRKVGLDRYVEVKIRDASQGVDEVGLDAAFIDVGDPWRVVESVYRALRPGSRAAFFIPTFDQVSKLYSTLTSHGGWGDIRGVELIERSLDLKEGAIRPSTRMIGHTGYIIVARKHLKEPPTNP